MRGLAAVAAAVVVVLVVVVVWLAVRAIRVGRARRRVGAAWCVEQWSGGGVTRVGVRRRPDPATVSDEIVVASIADDSPRWLDERAAAHLEARQRATELNADRPAP